MTESRHLVFEDGGVRSLRDHRHRGDAFTVLRTGKWANGSRLTGSDATTIATYLKPDVPKQRAKALRLHAAKSRRPA